MVYHRLYLSAKRILAVVIFGFCLISVPLASAYLEKINLPKEKFFYLPPVKLVEVIGGRFKNLAADFFYINGVMAVTDKFRDREKRVEWIQDNFGLAVYLDPELTEAYFFSGVVLSRDRTGMEKGIEFLEKYRYLNPSDWRIPYWIGFNYFQLGDYLTAAKFYEQAAGLPGSPGYLRSNQAFLYYRAGRADLGIMYLRALKQSVKDDRQLKWIEIKLLWLENIVFIQDTLNRFTAAYGRLPAGLNELVEKGFMSGVPKDPFGREYYLDADKGEIKSRFGPGENTSGGDNHGQKSFDCPCRGSDSCVNKEAGE